MPSSLRAVLLSTLLALTSIVPSSAAAKANDAPLRPLPTWGTGGGRVPAHRHPERNATMGVAQSPFDITARGATAALEERQATCSDPNYPYVNSCRPGYCCSTDACCPNTGDCAYEDTICCGEAQCTQQEVCCPGGCCDPGESCCDYYCCRSGYQCYLYDDGPYAGEYDCLRPAALSSYYHGLSIYYSRYQSYYASYTYHYSYGIIYSLPGGSVPPPTSATAAPASSPTVSAATFTPTSSTFSHEAFSSASFNPAALSSSIEAEQRSFSSKIASITANRPSLRSSEFSAIESALPTDPHCPGGYKPVGTLGLACLGKGGNTIIIVTYRAGGSSGGGGGPPSGFNGNGGGPTTTATSVAASGGGGGKSGAAPERFAARRVGSILAAAGVVVGVLMVWL